MTQGLRRALVLSILFHLFLLASARQLPWLPESQRKMAGVPIFASLRSDARVLPLDQPPERTTQAYEVPMVAPRELLKEPAVEKPQ